MEAVIFSVITTFVLIITFYVGRWFGIKYVMRRIEKELAEDVKKSSSVNEENK